MAYVSFVSRTDTSISVRLAGLDTTYDGNIITVNWKAGTGISNLRSYGTMTLSNKISQSGSFTFSGLSPSTKYHIRATVSASGCGQSYDFDEDFWTEDPPQPQVEKWDWFSSDERRNAYYAVTGKGNTTDFSYLVWNDMCAKVREIREAVGNIGSWDTANGLYLSYNNTLMSWSDKTLTAARFNSLKYQIGSQYGTGISDVSRGDTVYGHYFTTLTSRMNGWIDSL
jgi:hypothetical protein